MSPNKAFDAYKKSNNEYVEGIETPHGRVKILFDTVVDNIDNMIEVHPKTDSQHAHARMEHAKSSRYYA